MNIFKRPSAHYCKSPEPETPYQKAAQAWDERIGSARVQAKKPFDCRNKLLTEDRD